MFRNGWHCPILRIARVTVNITTCLYICLLVMHAIRSIMQGDEMLRCCCESAIGWIGTMPFHCQSSQQELFLSKVYLWCWSTWSIWEKRRLVCRLLWRTNRLHPLNLWMDLSQRLHPNTGTAHLYCHSQRDWAVHRKKASLFRPWQATQVAVSCNKRTRLYTTSLSVTSWKEHMLRSHWHGSRLG